MSVPLGPAAQGSTSGRFQTVVRVLVFLRRGDSVLLLRGAPDKAIWPGVLNGIGGHLEADEDPLSAARREVREECGLDLPPSSLRLAAVISIDLGPARTGVLLLAVLLFVTQVYPWYFLWPLPLVTVLGWRSPLAKAVVAFGLAFLPAYYLREFQSYGIFYLPLYLLAAVVVLAVTWGSDHVPRRRAWRAMSEATS